MIRASGSGLAQGQNKVGVIRLQGYDQYSINSSVNIPTNCKVLVVYEGNMLPTTTSNTDAATVSYNMPQVASGAVLVLLQPVSDVSNFPEQLYSVPCGATTIGDASKSFMVWNRIVGNGVSTATLFVVDANGNRTYRGGDFVQVFSGFNAPAIVVLGIEDNLDGSYTISLSMSSAAFVQQTPQPSLQVYLNNVLVQGATFSFPMNPLPMTDAVVSGVDPGIVTLGEAAGFTVWCFDENSLETSAGFYSAAVYLVSTGSRTPQYITCDVSPLKNAQLEVVYTVPIDFGKGIYHCHVIVNGTPIQGSPFSITVSDQKIINYSDPAYKVTSYVLGADSSQWSISQSPSWNIQVSDVTELNASTEVAVGGPDLLSCHLLLPSTDSWLVNGLMFSFDVKIQSTSPITIKPLTQAANTDLSMTWTATPDMNGSAGGTVQRKLDKWTGSADNKIGGTTQDITVANANQLLIDNTNSSTICYLYFLSPDQSTYGLYVFQAGQYITGLQWARPKNPPSTPQLGLTVQRIAPVKCTIEVSGVKIIPPAFRTQGGAPESNIDVNFSDGWAANYISIPASDPGVPITDVGFFDATGFHVYGTHLTNSDWRFLTPQPVPKYGASVAVYALTALKAYNDGKVADAIAAITFGGSFEDTNSGRWVNWVWGDSPVLEDIGPCNMKVDPKVVNTVFVVEGNGFVTVFSNGEFAFSITKRFLEPLGAASGPSLLSFGTDITWYGMRAVPGLQHR
ncbi:MAG: hypothetical protein Q9195_004500 [Heterodermia aff. obscurata]